MAQIIEIPHQRLPGDVLRALLEDYASRDGTDYGEVERSLDEKVAELQRQIDRGDLLVLYDGDSEEWDLAYKADAGVFMDSGR